MRHIVDVVQQLPDSSPPAVADLVPVMPMQTKAFLINLFIGVALCVSAVQMSAQGADPNAPVGTTPRILADIAAARKEAEKRLKYALQKAVHAIESSELIKRDKGSEMVIRDLQVAQAAWENFRKKQCSFLYSYYYEEIGFARGA